MASESLQATGAGDARQRILRAAVQLFSRKGYDATSIREIAEAASVTNPTLYYHFGNKEGLGHAIVREARDLLQSNVARLAGGSGDVREALVGFVEAHFKTCVENEELARFMFSLIFSPHESEAAFDVGEIHKEIQQSLKGILSQAAADGLVREGIEEEEAELVLMGIINVHLMVFLDQGMDLSRERAERAVKFFLEGVSPAKKAGRSRGK